MLQLPQQQLWMRYRKSTGKRLKLVDSWHNNQLDKAMRNAVKTLTQACQLAPLNKFILRSNWSLRYGNPVRAEIQHAQCHKQLYLQTQLKKSQGLNNKLKAWRHSQPNQHNLPWLQVSSKEWTSIHWTRNTRYSLTGSIGSWCQIRHLLPSLCHQQVHLHHLQ